MAHGRYSLIRKLATGGMAEVFLARPSDSADASQLLVVKRILPHLAGDLDFVTMFLNEARIAVRFNHPNIVKVFDLGREQDGYFIAMEYVDGADLGSLVRRAASSGRALPLELHLFVASAMCAALHYAHTARDERGRPLSVVHRDVSPQNVLVARDGAVKIVDFGVARAADQASTTRAGTVKGKVAYMAPEVACGLAFDHRVDQFATAMVLYEHLTGVRPFKRENDLATLNAVLRCEIAPPSKAAPFVPADLDRLLLKGLARSPEDRYPDSAAFGRAIDQYLAAHGLAPTAEELGRRLCAILDEPVTDESALEEISLGSLSAETVGPALPEAVGDPTPATLAPAGDATPATLEAPVGPSAEPQRPSRDAPPPLPPRASARRRISARALAAAAAALAIASGGATPQARSAARSLFQRLAGGLPASLPSEEPAGLARLTVESNVPVEVFLGDDDLGPTPLADHRVPAGALQVRLVNARFGIERNLALAARPGEAVVRRERFGMGRVRFRADPECEVFIQGELVAHAPGPALDYYEGTYDIECRNEALGASARARVVISALPSPPAEVTFAPSPVAAAP